MNKLKIDKNQGTGAKWHIMKKEKRKWKSLCGKIKTQKPEKDFKGLENKPAFGSWCGKCKKIYKGDKFKNYRTKGVLQP